MLAGPKHHALDRWSAALIVCFGAHALAAAHCLLPPKDLQRQRQLIAPNTPTPPTIQKPKETAVPKTRAGIALRWVLDAINSQDISKASEKCDPDFLKFIPEKELGEVFKDLHNNAFEGEDAIVAELIEGDRDDNLAATISTKRGSRYIDTLITVDDKSGLITGLRFTASSNPGDQGGGGGGGGGKGGASDNPVRKPGGWDAFADDLEDLGGDVAFAAYEMIQPDKGNPASPWALMPLAAKDEDTAMAINATGSLYILGALTEAIVADEAAWDEPLQIRAELKSLPGGRMQLEDAGASFPLVQYAKLMMSITDNTAADHLLERLGRAKVEAYTNKYNDITSKNTPFLSTREFFNLKLSADEFVREQYAHAADQEQFAMLSPGGAVHDLPLNMDGLREWGDPVAIHDINWFATPRQCCEMMAQLRRMELHEGMKPLGEVLRGNPGLGLDVELWPTVIYKGGSEPGVNAGTWMMQRQDGRWFTMSVIWNDRSTSLNNEKFIQVVYKGVDILEREGAARAGPGDVEPPEVDRPQDDGK